MTEVWVAWMDTGGISYSGAEFVAASESEDGVLEAMAGAFDEYLASGPDHGDDNRERWLAGHGPDDEEEQIPLDFGDGMLAFGCPSTTGSPASGWSSGRGARV